MMRKELIIGIVALILLTACGNLGGSSGTVDVHRGTEGITAKFLPSGPPSEIFENSPFTASIEVENKGSHHVDDGYLSLSIEDAFVKNLDKNIQTFALEAKTIDIPIGEKDIYTYQLESNHLGPQTEVVTTNIILNVCNDYATEAELSICVDTDVFDQDPREKACDVRAVGLSGGQGAPVSITRVTPTYTPTRDENSVRAVFTIELRNSNNGKTYASGESFEACTPQGVDSWNSARISAWLGDVQLECGDGTVDFKTGSDTIECSVLNGISATAGTYTTTMRVVLDYGYTFTETARVKIKRTS
jgi:hypothetical protein